MLPLIKPCIPLRSVHIVHLT